MHAVEVIANRGFPSSSIYPYGGRDRCPLNFNKYALTENDAREAKLREEIVGVRNHCDPGGGRRWEAMGGCGIAVGGGGRR